MRGSVLFLAAILFAAREARGDELHELKKELPVDAAVTTTLVGLVLASEIAKPDLVPNDPRWVWVNPVDERARDLVRWKDPRGAAYASDFAAFLVAPTAAFTSIAGAAVHDGAAQNFSTDALLVLEATAASVMLNQIVKFTVARERPYGHYRTVFSPIPEVDARLSFYSGHTNLAFTLAAAAGTVAHLRGYELAPLCWIPGATVAALTGFFRVAADKHYFTDVLVGAAAGTLMGIMVPLVFHPRADGTPAPATSAPSTTQMISIGSAF